MKIEAFFLSFLLFFSLMPALYGENYRNQIVTEQGYAYQIPKKNTSALSRFFHSIFSHFHSHARSENLPQEEIFIPKRRSARTNPLPHKKKIAVGPQGQGAQGQSSSSAARITNLPYQKKILELSEDLGSMYFLQDLCKTGKNPWRNKMQEIISTLKLPKENAKEAFASFNNAYLSFATNYRYCTSSAKIGFNNYKKEALNIIKDLLEHYGAQPY